MEEKKPEQARRMLTVIGFLSAHASSKAIRRIIYIYIMFVGLLNLSIWMCSPPNALWNIFPTPPARLVTSVQWQPLPEKLTAPSLSQPKHLSFGISPQLVPFNCKQFQNGVCPPLPQAVPQSSKPQGKKAKKVLTRQVPGNLRAAIYIHEAVEAVC